MIARLIVSGELFFEPFPLCFCPSRLSVPDVGHAAYLFRDKTHTISSILETPPYGSSWILIVPVSTLLPNKRHIPVGGKY